jgi:hypothetical protein
MYSKFFLVFFSLFLLLLSGLADSFQKRGAFNEAFAGSGRCRIRLTPSTNPRSTHFQLVREVICEK